MQALSPKPTSMKDWYNKYIAFNNRRQRAKESQGSGIDENSRLSAKRKRAGDEITKSDPQMKMWQKKCKAIEAEAAEAIENERKRYNTKLTEFNNHVKQSNKAKGLFENQIKVIGDELQTEKIKCKTLQQRIETLNQTIDNSNKMSNKRAKEVEKSLKYFKTQNEMNVSSF